MPPLIMTGSPQLPSESIRDYSYSRAAHWELIVGTYSDLVCIEFCCLPTINRSQNCANQSHTS